MTVVIWGRALVLRGLGRGRDGSFRASVLAEVGLPQPKEMIHALRLGYILALMS